MSMIADDVLRLFNINDFLKMLTIFRSKSSELTKCCLERKALNFFNLFDEITSVNDEKFNSKLKIFKYK